MANKQKIFISKTIDNTSIEKYIEEYEHVDHVSDQYSAADGNAVTLSYGFQSTPSYGMYLLGDRLILEAGGTNLGLDNSENAVILGAGGLIVPGTFIIDNNLGESIHLNSGSNIITLNTGGVANVTVSSSSLTSILPIKLLDGTQSAPAYGFTNYAGNGMFSDSSFDLKFSTSSGTRLTLNSLNGATLDIPLHVNLTGSTSAPAITFNNTSQGLYTDGTNAIANIPFRVEIPAYGSEVQVIAESKYRQTQQQQTLVSQSTEQQEQITTRPYNLPQQ